MKSTIEVPRLDTGTDNNTLAINDEGHEKNPKIERFSDIISYSSPDRENGLIPNKPSHNYKENYDLKKIDKLKTDTPEIVISYAPKEENSVSNSAYKTVSISPSTSTSDISAGMLYEKFESPTSSFQTDISTVKGDHIKFESESTTHVTKIVMMKYMKRELNPMSM
ncbi:11461_t:CDS:2 [Acaulospora morrowiae]|uniref:11461_t:CDS:1 n=1 Tax=Acaulospora morrowiae TaxID=94023 RepID=A0A9N9BK01_9GLOM|nr:11461_t:CDS:2 [Acaulospora morrowiae]